MGMTLIFTVFAAVAFLVSICLPHVAGGLGIDMMLGYLVLAVVSAVIGLLRRSAAR